MSWQLRVLALVLLVLPAGCAMLSGPRPQDATANAIDADAIEIRTWVGGSTPGTQNKDITWVLHSNGDCRGTIRTTVSALSVPERVIESQVQSKNAYQECKRLLQETRFFGMRSPGTMPRPGTNVTTIEVRTGRRRHDVSVQYGDPPPAGFAMIADFVNDMSKRAERKDPGPPGATDDAIKAPRPK